MMSQTQSMLTRVCVVLALSGAAASSRGFARQLTSCTNGCSTLLASAANFGVLAVSTVTSSGATQVDGNMGVPHGKSVTGFPPGKVTGTTYVGGDVQEQARADADTAFEALVAMPHNASAVLSGKDLKDMNLTSGKYYFSSSAQLSGNLTFDAEGNSSAVFVIQTESTFETSARSNILLVNKAKACNVFFAVGSSATIRTASVIRGSILAKASVTLQSEVIVHGAAVACNAAVSMSSNRVSSPTTCNWSGGNRPAPSPSQPGSK